MNFASRFSETTCAALEKMIISVNNVIHATSQAPATATDLSHARLPLTEQDFRSAKWLWRLLRRRTIFVRLE